MVKLDTLVVVRHGDYVGSAIKREDHLTDWGQREVRSLAQRLKVVLEGKVPMIITSNAPRAVESAKILAEILGVVETEVTKTFNQDTEQYDGEKFATFLKERADQAIPLVLVTHKNFAKGIAYEYCAINNITFTTEDLNLETGEAVASIGGERLQVFRNQK